jgi:hypothetical protein
VEGASLARTRARRWQTTNSYWLAGRIFVLVKLMDMFDIVHLYKWATLYVHPTIELLD